MLKDSNPELSCGYDPVLEDGVHVITSFELAYPSFSPFDQIDLGRKVYGLPPLFGGSSIVFRVDLGKVERWPMTEPEQTTKTQD